MESTGRQRSLHRRPAAQRRIAPAKRPSLTSFRPLGEGKNPNRHTAQGLGQLEAAMDRQGYVAPMTAARNGAILDGNARLEKAATKFDGVEPLVIEHDGRRPVIMVRTDIADEDDPLARDIIVSANRVAQVDLDLDADVLRAFAAEGLDLAPYEFDAAMLKEITGGMVGKMDPDAVPAERATDIQRGDLFELGRHRLLCGDSTTSGDVARLTGDVVADLVLTDPPYGIDIVGASGRLENEGGGSPFGGTRRGTIGGSKPFGSNTGPVIKSRKYKPIHGDDAPFDPTRLLTLAKVQIIFGANYFASKLPDGKAWIVWDKDVSGGFSECELAWTSLTGRLRMYRHMWSGLRREGPRHEELAARVHPTQKPVGLFASILTDFSEEHDVIIDPYLGSGSTLIACERMMRRCLGVEISPDYCQVIIDRWEAFTGQKALKVGEAVVA